MATEDESRISDFENGTKSMENQEYDNAIDSFQVNYFLNCFS